MAISLQGKRRIVVAGRTFYWFAIEEWDQNHHDGLQVRVMAAEGSLYLTYGVCQDDETRHIWNQETRLRVPCERIETANGAFTPSGVRRLIERYLEFTAPEVEQTKT